MDLSLSSSFFYFGCDELCYEISSFWVCAVLNSLTFWMMYLDHIISSLTLLFKSILFRIHSSGLYIIISSCLHAFQFTWLLFHLVIISIWMEGISSVVPCSSWCFPWTIGPLRGVNILLSSTLLQGYSSILFVRLSSVISDY